MPAWRKCLLKDFDPKLIAEKKRLIKMAYKRKRAQQKLEHKRLLEQEQYQTLA